MFLLLAETSVHGFQLLDRTELKAAMEAWCSNSTAAAATYSGICGSDVSLVTDMSYLLGHISDSSLTVSNCSTTFNSDINWDVSSVATMMGMFYDAQAPGYRSV